MTAGRDIPAGAGGTTRAPAGEQDDPYARWKAAIAPQITEIMRRAGMTRKPPPDEDDAA